MKHYKKTLFFASLISVFSIPVGAIQISSLAEIASEEGTAVFTIKNTEQHRIFLNIGMSELSVDEGNIKKTAYTRENLEQWKINVHPARTIIEPGFEKDFRVSLVNPKNSDQKEDALYQVAFVPSPYFPDGEKPNHAVQMAVGFAGLFIVPGEETKPQIVGSYDGNKVMLNNPGPNAVRASVDFCSGNARYDKPKDCRRNIYLLSGRKLSISKPDMANENSQVKIEAKSLEGNFVQELELEAPSS
ncbi:hypothetical protein M5252_004726 [Vibrio parahaemolyticus]|nr:hypothetical protein [Vibrio parahaemolyticus]EJE8775166.1 hypothetical protein [Vibrio parahaemolyticus]